MKPYLIPADDIPGNPFEQRHYYKIYHDGGHHVGTRIVRSNVKRLQEREKNLKENFQKKKTVVFRKRISAKTTVFLVFKSVSE